MPDDRPDDDEPDDDEPDTGAPDTGDAAAGWASPDETAREPAVGSTTPTSAPPPSTPPPDPSMSRPPGVAPAPGAPAAVGTGPRPRGRGWVVVLVVALTVIALVIAAGTALFVDRTKPPYDAAQAFFEDLLEFPQGEASTARLCSRDRENADDAVAEVVETLSAVGRAEVLVNFLGVDRSGDVATVKYSVKPSVGVSRAFELPLREEDGSWQVCPSDGVREVDD